MKKRVALLIFFLLIFFLYRLSSTGQPTGYADSDELIVTSYFHSVSHPPGFSLFTSLGHLLFSLFTPFANPAVVSQLISALYHTITLFFIFLTAKSLTKYFHPLIPENTHTLLALIGITSLALSYDFWLYATIYEVTALTVMLGAATLYAAIHWLTQEKPASPSYYLTWIAAGLLLTHYHLAIIFFPGLLLALIAKHNQTQIPFKKIVQPTLIGLIALIIVFMAGNSLLFIQNQPHPISWNFANTLTGWWRHIVRFDYTGIDLETDTRFDSAFPLLVPIDSYSLESIFDYLVHLAKSFTIIPAILAFFGVIFLIKNHRHNTGFLLILFLFSGPMLAAYMRTSAIQFQPALHNGIAFRQFFLSYLLIPLFIPFGVLFLSRIFQSNTKKQNYVIYVTAGIILISQLIANSALLQDKSDRLQAATFAQNRLQQAADNALLICTNDFDCYTLFYYHYVAGLRPDLTVISHVPAYNNHYLSQKKEIIPFLIPQNPEFLTAIITSNLSTKTIYLTGGLNFYSEYFGWEDGPLYLNPENTLLRVTTTFPSASNLSPIAAPQNTIDQRNQYGRGIREIIGNLYAYQGYLSMKYQLDDQARMFLNTSAQYNPNDPQTKELITYFEQISEQASIEEINYSLIDMQKLAQESETNNQLEEADKWYRLSSVLFSDDQTVLQANLDFYQRHQIPDRFNLLSKQLDRLKNQTERE